MCYTPFVTTACLGPLKLQHSLLAVSQFSFADDQAKGDGYTVSSSLVQVPQSCVYIMRNKILIGSDGVPCFACLRPLGYHISPWASKSQLATSLFCWLS